MKHLPTHANLRLTALALSLAACLGPVHALDLGVDKLGGYLHDLTPTFPTFDPWRVMPPERPGGALPGDQTAPDGCAAEVPAGLLTLQQAVELALCRNPQTQGAWAEARAKAAQIGAAKAAYLPTVNANLSRIRDELDQEVIGTVGNSRSDSKLIAFGRNVSMNWLLLDLGARSANIEQAQQLFVAALATQNATVQNVFANAAQAYYDTWAAQAALAAALEAESSAKENLSAAQAKLKFGTGTRVEELQAQAALSKTTLDRVRAEGSARMAVGLLAAALGMDARTPLKLASDDDPGSAAPEQPTDRVRFLDNLDRLMDEASRNHPAVQSARAQLAAAEARTQGVISEGLPSVSLSMGRYISGRPNNAVTQTKSFETVTTLTLAIPLFEGFSRNYRIQEARAQVQARQADLANVQSQTSVEAWRNYQSLLVETTAVGASADLVRGNEEALDAARARYKSGAIDILDLLSAQKDLAQARQERIRSLSAWRTARLKLLASLGQLGYWALDTPASAAYRPEPAPLPGPAPVVIPQPKPLLRTTPSEPEPSADASGEP